MKTFLSTILIVFTSSIINASISFSGSSFSVVSEKPEASTGLTSIYVLHDFDGVKMTYTATSSSPVTWYKFNNAGGSSVESLNNITKNGKTYTLDLTGRDDMGYIIEEGSSKYYYWVIDYSKHCAQLSSIGYTPGQDGCYEVELTFVGNANRINYYTINGQPKELDRGLKLSYYNLQYNEGTESYEQIITEKPISYINNFIYATTPLCNTEFTLSGDRFLKQWGEEQSITSDTYISNAVEAKTTAIQISREISNEQKEETALGGSAPCEITFNAICSDAAIFQEWQIATDPEFNDIAIRFNEPNITYTFREQGTSYVRFMASNSTGSCEYFSETYEVFIGASRLQCPNIFSPEASEGINDEWKVSYKSITSFKCNIFNRWGIKIAELTDPSQGWDGKYKGKYVPSGVYYYVIKAEGADGVKYDLSGDINIIKFSGSSGTTSTPTE